MVFPLGSDPFHTGGWTGKSPYFFDFWYWRTNSVRSKNKVEAFSGENPYSKLGLLASCKTRTCQKSGFYPEFEDSREVQLGSLAAIGFLLQIRDLLGDIDRFERSVRFKFSRVGLIQIFPGNRKGANSNVFGGKKAKPYLTVAPYKVRTSSGPKLPVWNGSQNQKSQIRT